MGEEYLLYHPASFLLHKLSSFSSVTPQIICLKQASITSQGVCAVQRGDGGGVEGGRRGCLADLPFNN